MTEPTFQRKSWPIGPGVFSAVAVGIIVIIVALLWLLLISAERQNQVAQRENQTAASTAVPSPQHTTPARSVPAAVTEFLNYVQIHPTEAAMDKDHAYTSNGIRKLTAALAALSEREGIHNAEVERQLTQLRQQADRIQADPQATSHAGTIRTAFTAVADLMATLQKQAYPQLDAQVTQVRRAAEAIDPAQLTLQQKAQIGAFFTQASEAIQAMAQARG